MARGVALHHLISYRYDRPVSLSPHVVQLRPAPPCWARVLSYPMRVMPDPGVIEVNMHPAHSWESESRRLSGFFRNTHTPGTVVAVEPRRSREFPFTLDLRAD